MKAIGYEPGERGLLVALSILCIVIVAGLIWLAIPAPSATSVTQPKTLPSSYSDVTLPYHGHPLHCIQWDEGSAYNAPSGITCDWVRYHHLGAPA